MVNPCFLARIRTKGIILKDSHPTVVELGDEYSESDILVHDETNPIISHLLLEMTLDPSTPTPFGILRAVNEPTYDELLIDQIDEVKEAKGEGDLETLFYSGDVWEVK